MSSAACSEGLYTSGGSVDEKAMRQNIIENLTVSRTRKRHRTNFDTRYHHTPIILSGTGLRGYAYSSPNFFRDRLADLADQRIHSRGAEPLASDRRILRYCVREKVSFEFVATSNTVQRG